MRFVSRAEWGARVPKHRTSIGDVYGCTIHWNGPAVGAIDHSECDDTMRGFQRYHMDTRGWSDIGYNFVVCRHGHVFEGRGIGIRGAHEESLNAHWYGIQCMVGRGDGIPAAAYDGLRDAIGHCRDHGAGNRVNAHRDADATSCPGDELAAWTRMGKSMEDDVSADEVWTHEIPTPHNADNTKMYAEWVASQTHNRTGDNRKLLREIAKTVGAPVDIDEQAIVADILAAMPTVEEKAEAVAAALPDDLARDVVSALARRLNTQSSA